MLAFQVIARIKRVFEVEMSIRSLFEEPTIAGLAGEVEKGKAKGTKMREPVLARRARPT